MRHVLVTGGAGFIGSHLVRRLVREAVSVVVLDNLVNGQRQNIADVLGPRCRLVVADIRDLDTLRESLRDRDTVFHLACLGVRHSLHSPMENHEVNATATLGLLEIAREVGVKRFVHVSSSEIYGTAVGVPMTEDHPTRPATVYGAAKLAGESYARAQFLTHGFATTVVRPFNAFGPCSHHEGDCGEVIPKFMLRALAGRPLVIFSDGQQTRDFTYVEDTAAGIIAAGRSLDAIGRTFNLGSGREISISSLAQEVGAVLGVPVRVVYEAPRPGDVRRLFADASAASSTFGFAASTPLNAGLRRLHQWYLQRGAAADLLLEEESVHNWELRE